MRPFVILFFALCMMSLSSCATRVVTKPVKVTVVQKTPRHYKIVKIKGKRYYFWNGNHYRKTRKGYVVVRI